MLFGREESFWDTDGDTAEREREREVSGKYKKYCRHTHNAEKISITQHVLVREIQMIQIIFQSPKYFLHPSFLLMSNFSLDLILE